MHWQILYQFLLIKQVITNNQRFFPSPMFSNTCNFLYFYILSHLFSFFNNFQPPPHLPPFFLFFPFSNPPNPAFADYTQSKTSSAVFCSNAVLITTSNSSLHFFSFFDVLPSAPTTTGMTLMLLMFHILLISLFSSWFLSIFPSLFH